MDRRIPLGLAIAARKLLDLAADNGAKDRTTWVLRGAVHLRASANLTEVARSNADRPYGSFRRLFDDVVEAPPTPKIAWRVGVAHLLGRARSARLIGLGALVSLLIVAVATSVSPGPRQLTDADVAEAIKQALASATPRPNLAIAAYEGIKRSVVTVKTRSAAETDLEARGSGVLMDAGETILTSLHVVRDAVEITVVFFDGQEAPAAVGEAAPEYDIAVLDVTGIGQRPAVFAGTKNLKVGDEAFVVGSPLGLSNSLSVGVISKLESTFQPTWRTKPLGGLIQFNAAVYPGNSGGALVNRNGEVIAIVTVVADAVGVSGIGFAVPIEGAASAAGSNPF